ncbi:hypothetical protein HK103_004979 [Boothiomyces macroporosus]|uniref:HMG box domain-containing protein n=1 Tax=Boothiomyces macroporosus TaxID=261099 RepID=A0AAD5UFQ9_9FUNG|nr:hypothetical protein HK103_004979 [Boothiomyces macroporosus]
MNAFFFYRNHLKAHLEETNSTTNSNEISKIAAAQWKKEPEQVKKIYKDLSKRAYDEFKLKYPDFEWNHKKRIKRDTGSIYNEEVQVPETSLQDSKNDSNAIENSPISISDADIVEKSSPQSTGYISDWSEQFSDFDDLVDSFIKEFNPSYPYQYNGLN